MLKQSLVIIGRIGAPFGVKGAVHLQSFTEPSDNILNYKKWYIRLKDDWHEVHVIDIKHHGKGYIAVLKDCLDRNEAALLTNAEIGIERTNLPELKEGEYYWTDLIDLTVINESDVELGVVTDLIETGSNDVLVVQGKTQVFLIPYIPDTYILKVDLSSKTIHVHWEAEY